MKRSKTKPIKLQKVKASHPRKRCLQVKNIEKDQMKIEMKLILNMQESKLYQTQCMIGRTIRK